MQDGNTLPESLQQGTSQSPQIAEQKEAQVPEGVKQNKSKTLVIILAILGILLLVGAAGVGAYLILSKSGEGDKTSETTTTTSTTTTPVTTATTTVTTTTASSQKDLYEGWKTYENEEFSVSFRYPNDWVLDEDIDEFEGSRSLIVTVTKNDYSFELHIPSASSPTLCTYPDTDPADVPEHVFALDYNEYTEINDERIIYRRGLGPNSGTYVVCQKANNSSEKLFETWTYPGYVDYKVRAKDLDESILSTMDKILLSKNNDNPSA